MWLHDDGNVVVTCPTRPIGQGGMCIGRYTQNGIQGVPPRRRGKSPYRQFDVGGRVMLDLFRVGFASTLDGAPGQREWQRLSEIVGAVRVEQVTARLEYVRLDGRPAPLGICSHFPDKIEFVVYYDGDNKVVYEERVYEERESGFDCSGYDVANIEFAYVLPDGWEPVDAWMIREVSTYDMIRPVIKRESVTWRVRRKLGE